MLRFVPLALGILLALSSCGGGKPVTIAANDCDQLSGFVDHDDEMSIDRQDKVQGEGSLYVKTEEKRVVRLLDIENPDLEGVLVSCTAEAKCIGIWGRVYLELWCTIPGEGDFSARDWDHSVHATQDWTPIRVDYEVPKGRRPSRIWLNLVINSGGSVWLDDLKITATPLD